jgi:WhiB family redox-sensing transcriptional regulator
MVQDWRVEAACRGVDPELFFPASEVGPGARQVAQAKAVCARCPVSASCRAELGMQEFGVFGGLSAGERRTLRVSV